MKIAISGGTGFIGRPLVERRLQRGDDVLVISRHPRDVAGARGIGWNDVDAIADADAVVNLAAENVGVRWTVERKRRIVESRVNTTAKLVDAMRRGGEKQRTLISPSGVGFYGLHADDILDESAGSGSGFLAELTRDWEAAAHRADDFARVVVFRFGVVLDANGGALKRMLLPFRLGVGGPIGSGTQWMSWVDREDAVRAIEWAIDDPRVQGTYNITAPEPVRNRDFARALGRAMHRPSLFAVPGFVIRLLFGEMSGEMLLGGQRVVPSRATREGFAFRYPTIDTALQRMF